MPKRLLAAASLVAIAAHISSQLFWIGGSMPKHVDEDDDRHFRRAVILYPGSFSPVQLSHLRTAAIAKDAVEASVHRLRVHSVQLSAVSDGYGKQGLWPAPERMRLIDLALRDGQWRGLELDRWEGEQVDFKYTSEVAHRFMKEYVREDGTGKAQLLLLAGGADLFQGMFALKVTPQIPKPWTAESVARLLHELDGIVIIQRAGTETWTKQTIIGNLSEKLKDQPSALRRLDDFLVIVAEATAGDGSSTKVRELIREGLDSKAKAEALADLVGQEVAQAIVTRKDYFQGLVTAG
eukprot:TRINITY_DN73174_c0_g1_i1.p1 TRINITY_DN73174_c0_g1~~TRINITY_DN73174_c0_g1_i1.p1  ORF type:complete len:294 (+),score=76.30 TRINITY_DN73174_c0_g1_i1:52-933(+)